MNPVFLQRTALGLAIAAAVSGCGGGGGNAVVETPPPSTPPVATSEVPASAGASAAGATAFVRSVAATPSDATEPLVVGDATLATSETDEPENL